MTLETRDAETATVLQRAVCLILTCSYLGNSRNVNTKTLTMGLKTSATETQEVEHTDEVRVTKTLVDKRLLQPAHSAIGAVKETLRSMSTQSHRVFGPGTYLIAKPMVLEVVRALNEGKAHVRSIGAKIADDWEAEVVRRRERLGPLFNAADYPTREEVMEAFDIEWSFIKFSAADNLEDVDGALAEAEHRKFERRLSDAFDEIMLGMRADALQIVTELIEKIGDNEDGKPKVLRPTALRDLETYLAMLPRRNTIARDDLLVAAMDDLRRLTVGLDVEMLRKAPAVRESLREKAEQAAAVLKGLVETGSRGIRLGGTLLAAS